MWIKLKSGNYFNMDNGHMMGVKAPGNGNPGTGWRVWIGTGLGNPQHIAEEGFKSASDAQHSLDEFMTDKDFVAVSPPITDEELGSTDKEDAE